MIQEAIHFLLQVAASTCGILLGAAIADTVGKIRYNNRWKKARRDHR